MIIVFATQKGGVGKTTLAIAFANYLSLKHNKKVHVFDFDWQKSFYAKWKEEATLDTSLYEVEVLEDTPFDDMEEAIAWSESKEIYLVDLAGNLDSKYTDLLMYSDFIVIPFEYSDVSVKSTLVFIHILSNMGSEAQRVFIRSRYDKGFNYLNQQAMDIEISKYGHLLHEPVYKRNALQTITTRALNYHQKKAITKPFDELITYMNIPQP